MAITRRRFLQTGGAAITAGALIAGAGLFESNDPRLVRLEIPIAGLPAAFDGFTIAQLSDFHYDPYFSVTPIRKGVEIAQQSHADLMVLTGDFVTITTEADYLHIDKKKCADAIDPCVALLSPLSAPYGKFAILGNHDAGSDGPRIAATLQDHGIPVLRNRSMPIERNGERIWLAGLDDAIEGKPNPEVAIKGIPNGERIILLLHEPDLADRMMKFPIDLQLSGHSHGGQVWVPLLGAPWLPDLAVKYPRGLYHIGKLVLYTNAGLGTIRAPVRLNAPPEVTLVTLRVR